MLGIDTNLIVRYLTGDHVQQAAKARALIDRHDVFVATTVFLEAEWVLRSAYGFAPERVASALGTFAALPRVTLEHPALVATALGWMEQGMDFADALHLAACAGCEAFVSFDRQFAKMANALGGVNVRSP
ncbi:MAG: type II toxin-antitoxin system VapC family toxin [Rhizomicrobium sp.]